MVVLWDSYGVSKGCLWGFLWVPIVFLWYFYGVSLGCTWYFFWISMIFLWNYYGIKKPMIFLRGFFGNSMGCPWSFFGISMVVLWYFYGISIGLLNVSRVFLWYFLLSYFFTFLARSILLEFSKSLISQNIGCLIKTQLKNSTQTIFQGSSPWATLPQ